MRQRVAVVGGGLTGLSACYHLEKLGFNEVTLFEASSRLGGKLQSVCSDDFRYELGPDSIFTRDRRILDFIDELGLTTEVIEPSVRGFSIYLDGALRLIPSGVSRVASVDPEALANFQFLSETAKAAVASERNVPPNLAPDESVAGFFRRRFGVEYAVKIAEPLFAGTHGGGAEELSMEALYPSYRDAERRFGSLGAASEAGAMKGAAKFVSFRNGIETLTHRLASRLKVTKTENAIVKTVRAYENRVEIDGREFDAAIVTVPAYEAASLLPDVAHLLGQISASSSIIAIFRYDQTAEALGLAGTGFLMPEAADEAIRAATWSSLKWGSGSDKAAIRVFLTWSDLDDAALLEEAKVGLKRIAGIEVDPNFQIFQRWPRGLPQYRMGHLELIQEIESQLKGQPPILLAGQSYRGAGIPDCVRQGRQAAETLAAS